MKITPEFLVAATHCSGSIALSAAPALDAAMARFDILSNARVAAFIAQLAHESGGFTRTRENMNYSKPETLMKTWPSRFPSLDFARQYIKVPEKLANYVYCNRLGNGPIASGDGYRFRGGAWTQITGLAMWRACADAIGYPIVDDQRLIDQPTVSALASAWFWSANGLLALADRDTLDGYRTLTKRLNGGLVGFEDGNDWGNDDRVENWATVKRAMGIAA